MGESQYSASLMSASTRSFATLDQSLVTQSPLSLFFKLIPMQAITEILRQAKVLILLHVMLHFNGIEISKFYAGLQPFIELIVTVFPEAYGLLAKKRLQTFVLNHQAYVADIYLIYNFLCMMTFQIIVSVIIAGLYNYILPNLTADPKISNYYIYFMIGILSAPISSSLANYIEIIMDAEKEKFKCCLVKIVDPILTIIFFQTYELMKPKNTKGPTIYIFFGIIQMVAQIISCSNQLYALWRKKGNRLPIRMSMFSFKPFRAAFLLKQYYQQYPYLFQVAGEPLVQILLIIFTQKDYNEELSYPNASILVFIYIRQLTKMGQCLQFSAKRFLDLYINSNLQISAHQRIYKVLFVGFFIHLAFNLAMSGIIYWLAPLCAQLTYPLGSLNQYEQTTFKTLFGEANKAALHVFINTVTPFTQSFLYNINNKFTSSMLLCTQIIEWLCIAMIVILFIVRQQAYLYYNMYTGYQLIVGISNIAMYPVILIRYKKYANENGIQTIDLSQEDINPTMGMQQQQDQNKDSIQQNEGNPNPNNQSSLLIPSFTINKSSRKMSEHPNLDQLFGIPDSKSNTGIMNSSDKSKGSDQKESSLNNLVQEIDLNDDFVLKPLKGQQQKGKHNTISLD